jgi:hypothetical protein
MKPRLRDRKGRFKKASPLLDQQIVAKLGTDRRAVSFVTDYPWELEILDKQAWRAMVDGTREPDSNAKASERKEASTKRTS